VLLEEERDMIFAAGDDEYSIDFDITLCARDTKVICEDTKEGMFAIRVADWLREEGGAMYLSCDGDRSPVKENIWGERARWVRLEAERDGQTIGIAIMNHPDSVNYPTYWHARGYGLFSANPLGQHRFQKDRGVEDPQAFELTLAPGQEARFRFLMLIYEGDRTSQQFEERFNEFAG
jgi:hypothetical protein